VDLIHGDSKCLAWSDPGRVWSDPGRARRPRGGLHRHLV